MLKTKVMQAIAMLRDDRTRLHVGIAFVVIGLALFGMYFPKAMSSDNAAQRPGAQQATAPGQSAAVAGESTGGGDGTTDADPNTPTHAGAPAPGQKKAEIPGTNPEKCKAGTSAGKSSAPAGLKGTIDVTLPVGCTSGSYELRTDNGREVQWAALYGGFRYKNGGYYNQRATAYAVVNLPFNQEGQKSSSIRYTVTAEGHAAPGTYENGLYIQDASHKDGGYKVVIRVTVKE